MPPVLTNPYPLLRRTDIKVMWHEQNKTMTLSKQKASVSDVTVQGMSFSWHVFCVLKIMEQHFNVRIPSKQKQDSSLIIMYSMTNRLLNYCLKRWNMA